MGRVFLAAHSAAGAARFIVLLALNWLSLLAFHPGTQPRVTVPFSPYFLTQLNEGHIKSISTKGDTVDGIFTTKMTYPANSDTARPTTLFATEVPSFWNNAALTTQLEDKGVQVNAKSTSSGTSLFAEIILGFGPTLLLVGLFVLLGRRAAAAGSGGGLGGLGNFGRSQARRVDPEQIRVTFAVVAGIDEAKEELSEIVDFLKTPERYQALGGRMPHGVLLYGPPGTGKTLLARAVAGEAHAAFFSIAASEFIEAIVGVGAARVLDLFAKAKEAEPSIIFIDELDAIGRSRQGSAGITGANDEREQTLDQILTEMDGFDSREAVVVLRATNRPEILDAALLRPGRFDRRVAVQAPDRAGRLKVLQVHTRAIPLGDSVELDQIAASTPGMVGADLANLCNEAALLAAKRNHRTVQMADFTDSLEKIMLGAPRGIMLSHDDRERTAYHESGHALVGMLTPGADPVRKVSIIPRGQALGVTLSTPDADRVSYSREDLEAKISVALGGRVAEEVVYGKITTGAESDIQQLTQIARQMVGRWGMSDKFGPLALLPSEGAGGYLLPGGAETSQQTQWLIDEEVRRIVDEAHAEVTRLLTDHRDEIESLTRALLAAETLDAADAYAAAQMNSQAAASEPNGPGKRGVNGDSLRSPRAERRQGERARPARAARTGPATRIPYYRQSHPPVIEHVNTEGGPTKCRDTSYTPATSHPRGFQFTGCSLYQLVVADEARSRIRWRALALAAGQMVDMRVTGRPGSDTPVRGFEILSRRRVRGTAARAAVGYAMQSSLAPLSAVAAALADQRVTRQFRAAAVAPLIVTVIVNPVLGVSAWPWQWTRSDWTHELALKSVLAIAVVAAR